MHLILWKNVMLDFICMDAKQWGTGSIKLNIQNENIIFPIGIESAIPCFPTWHLRPLGYTLTDDKLRLKLVHNHDMNKINMQQCMYQINYGYMCTGTVR